MKSVAREFDVALEAAKLLARELRANPSFLRGSLGVADARVYRENLESTYTLRIFAEFEQGLRDWWTRGLGKQTKPQVFDLIQAAARKRNIPDDLRGDVHSVQIYRNSIIHADDLKAAAVSFPSARSSLFIFFSRLPPDW